jgi:methionyl-tRNA synthetase
MNFPESKDSDFTWKDFQARNNNELSAVYGNFVNRTLQFIHKNFGGRIPQLPEKYHNLDGMWKELILFFESNTYSKEILNLIPDDIKAYFNSNDLNVIFSLWLGKKLASGLYEKYRFRDAITETMNIARAANKYFNDDEPWKSAKTNPDECAKTLYICVQLVNSFSILFAPFVPNSSRTIASFLHLTPVTGVPGETKSHDFSFWDSALFPMLKENSDILMPELLFFKIDDSVISSQIAKLGEKNNNEANDSDLIGIEDFQKIKLRIGKVLEAENVPKSKKLIKMIVDIGNEKRQVLAGVAEYYRPEELTGRSIVVVANLKPTKLMGIESQGMMLAASDETGKLCFVTTEKDIIKQGGEVR